MKTKYLLAILLLFAIVPAALAMENTKHKDEKTEEVAGEQVNKESTVTGDENPEEESGGEEEAGDESEEEKEATEEDYDAQSESGESDDEEGTPKPKVPANTEEAPATPQPQEETGAEITHNVIGQYLWFHVRHFFSIEQTKGQFRNITSQELLRLWNDAKSQSGNLSKVFTGEANQDSKFSVQNSFLERLGNGVQASWQSKNVKGAIAGTVIVTALDFLLTNLTTWEKESHKNLMEKFKSRSISFKPEENSRVMALVFYSFLAMMGARLGDHDADINNKNLIEILVKVAIGTAAGSLAWNSLRRYIFGKGSDFSTNFKKAGKFALLCAVALGAGNLTAGQLAND
ncbi:hypothetical protein KAT92_01285 [Candidatus Babeliales bacterium]|nr:hypothetical protein [Candidatus Babeliales bacterium]